MSRNSNSHVRIYNNSKLSAIALLEALFEENKEAYPSTENLENYLHVCVIYNFLQTKILRYGKH